MERIRSQEMTGFKNDLKRGAEHELRLEHFGVKRMFIAYNYTYTTGTEYQESKVHVFTSKIIFLFIEYITRTEYQESNVHVFTSKIIFLFTEYITRHLITYILKEKCRFVIRSPNYDMHTVYCTQVYGTVKENRTYANKIIDEHTKL